MNARTAISLATILVVAALWYLFTSATGWVGAARFPNPIEFGTAVKQIAVSGYADGRIHQHAIGVEPLHAIGLDDCVVPGRLTVGPTIPLPIPAVAFCPPSTCVAVFVGVAGATRHPAVGKQFDRARVAVDSLVEQSQAAQCRAKSFAAQHATFVHGELLQPTFRGITYRTRQRGYPCAYASGRQAGEAQPEGVSRAIASGVALLNGIDEDATPLGNSRQCGDIQIVWALNPERRPAWGWTDLDPSMQIMV